MDMNAVEITTKMMVGEDVTEEEKSYARNYNAKYSIVRHLVMEKMSTDKSMELKNFHFTPGSDFMEIPTVDVVNSIVESFVGLKDAIPVDFYDDSWGEEGKYSNPPTTGTAKTTLG